MTFFFYASYLNSDLKAENFVQKLKNFINYVYVKFSEVGRLNDYETKEFNQSQLLFYYFSSKTR